MMFFLVATTYRKTQTQPLNPPPSFLTNHNQTEPINIKAIQPCVQGMEDQQHRSPKLRRHQRQHMLQQPQHSRLDLPKSKITEKTQVFCDLDGGLLTSCYKMTFFVAEVRCQTHKLKQFETHVSVYYILVKFFCIFRKKILCVFSFLFHCAKKKPTGSEQLFSWMVIVTPKEVHLFCFQDCAPVPLSLELLSIQKCHPSFRTGDSEFSDGKCINLLESVDGNIPSFEAASSSSSSRLGGPR